MVEEDRGALSIGNPGLIAAPALQVFKVDLPKHVGGGGHIHNPGRPAKHSCH